MPNEGKTKGKTKESESERCIKLIESIKRKQFIKRVIRHSHTGAALFSINLQLLKVQRKRRCSKHEILIKIYKKWEWDCEW